MTTEFMVRKLLVGQGYINVLQGCDINITMTLVRKWELESQGIGSHAWPGFNPSNVDHELCHYTDDVTRMAGLQLWQRRP